MKTPILKGLVLLAFFALWTNQLQAQCTSINVNLTGVPDSLWRSSLISRNGQCCSATGSQECITFNITLDPNTAGVWFYMTGAPALGSEYYKVGCGASYSMRDTICLTGVGPHSITFCKPGNNPNEYIIQAIAKPTFPPNDSVRIGCSEIIHTYGMKQGSIVWNSIYPGAPGTHNSYLSCTNCAAPSFTPSAGAPAYIDYVICGDPIATMCGYNLRTCDTVRIYTFPTLTGSVSPNPASFCNIGPSPGITLTASANGGNGVYSYIWRNSAGTVVGIGSNYYALTNEAFTVEIRDGLNSSTCPGYSVTVPVTAGAIPVVNAGSDQYLCASSPLAYLSGSVQYATGGNWLGGNGVFNPGRSFLNATYTPTAAEIASGSVQLVLESAGAGGGCPNATDTIIINYPSPVSVSINAGILSCNNSTAVISSSVSGGMLPYSYSWNTGASSSSIIAGQGLYQLTVTDALGCYATSSVNMTAPASLSVLLSSTNVSVNGGSDGTASVIVSGGTGPYTYAWNTAPAQTGSTATGLAYGVYNVAVTDANGCTIGGSVVVNEPRCLGFSVAVSNFALECYGDNNGSLSSTVTAGAAPYSYSWSSVPAQTTSTATDLSAGSYLLTVTDANSCIQVSYGTVTEPAQLVNMMSHTDVSLIGGNDGSAAANPTGGTPGYSYLWNTLATTQTISSLTAATYNVTVTDNNGCSVSDTVGIAEPPCNNLVVGVTTENIACYGGSTGSASVYMMHGNAPFTIQWSTGSTTPSISGLAAGNYWVKITDNINCEETVYFTLTQPSPLSMVLAPSNVSCNGFANGSIETTVSGGTYPYSYSWSNSMSAEDLHNLFPGTYSVNVTDRNGCSAFAQATISEPAQMSVASTVTTVSCFNGNNGTIDLTVTGGVVPYSYNWSNGATTQDISNINAGYYVVSVQDANSCSLNAPITILVDQPDSISIDSGVVSCPAPGAGITNVQLYASGGTGAFSFSFDNGSTYQPAGLNNFSLPIDSSYTVLVKDNNNCVVPVSFSLNIDRAVVIDSVSFPVCNYIPSASTAVTVYAAGGDNGPYSVSMDGGSTFGTAGTYTFTLPIGNTYYVVVKDAKGCLSVIDTIVIPAALTSSVAITSNFNGQHISCNGASDGAVDLTVNGGTGVYSYLWSNGATTQDLSAITAGTYSVTITDVNGCSTTANVTLTEPAALASSLAITSNFNGQHISCNGASDGAVDLTVNGGTGVYSYLWSNGATTQDLSILAAGTYSVTITDANGCSTTASVTLTEPAALTSSVAIISNFNGQHISCNGAADGAADLTVNGGIGAYTYAWSNGATTQNISGLIAGTYSVTVTDANGCSITNGVTLTEPAALTSSVAIISNFNGQHISCNGASDGAVDLLMNGGTGAYTYVWSNGATTQDISGLVAGTYSVTITDSNGCSTTSSITLTEPAALTSSIAITSNFNGQHISCNGAADGAVDLTVNGGTGAYTYTWSNGATTQDLSAITAGTYSVTITDANGCSTTNSVTLTEPAALTSSVAITSNFNGQHISCNGAGDGAVDLTVIGGTGAYSYLWSNGAVTEDLSGIPAGSYSAVITDENGCTSISSISLIEPSTLAATFSTVNINCSGYSNGAIDVTVTGGTQAYAYSWSNGATTEDLAGLSAGSYSLTVMDVNGCTATYSVSVTQEQPIAISSIANNVKCYNGNDGAIELTVLGGVLPYQVTWSNGASTEDLNDLTAGIYSVVITDANNCSSSDTITITQPDSLYVTLTAYEYANGYNVSLNGAQDGSIDAEIYGGTAPYTTNWSNNSFSEDLANIGAGDYTLVVSDFNGCLASTSMRIEQPYVLEMPTGYSPNGDGKNDMFVVRGLESYPDNRIEVYNRWGNIVYSADNYQNQWNGLNSAGEELPAATYFVILNISNEKIVLKGYVDLRR